MGLKLSLAYFITLFVAQTSCSYGTWSNERVASEFARREDLPRYRHDAREWEDMVKIFLEGKGSLIGRTAEGKEKIDAYRKTNELRGINPETATLSRIGWDSSGPRIEKNLWELHEEDPQGQLYKQYINVEKNEFPYEHSNKAVHWLFWLRVPFVTKEFFEAREGEILPRARGYDNPEKVKALVNYISFFDFFGCYGIPESFTEKVRQAEFAHPAHGHVWTDQETGISITREEGVAAMKWAGRHVNRMLQTHFPEHLYEVIWNTSPARFKSVPRPQHVHAIVYPKHDPKSITQSH